ncbi:vgr related protein [Novosphingobium percolationis]|uniref:vgr related protein n=1 Tax=Novosphingobium percolationis TaxID=2871811 RepID=UPI001CD2A32A|nr:vgr related protein [Novosphingobium percolationis]
MADNSERALTPGECALVCSVFGEAIALEPVRLKRRRFFPFQPRGTVMAPMGHIHFHPRGPHWREDFALAPLSLQGLFIHEMVHVWQTQQRGRWWLPLMRHPFCRYDYRFVPGKPFGAYGIEQQAEIVRHWFLARHGFRHDHAPSHEAFARLIPFTNS